MYMKTINQREAMKSVRKQWDFSPVTRKVESRKAYSRKQKFNKNWQ